MSPADSRAEMNPAERLVLLVLDDSAQDREILNRLLGSDPRCEYVLHERANIEDAMQAVRELQPDCILLDYSLGDGNGLDFLEELRTAGGTRAYPVVMLTGSGSEEVAAKAFRAGAQDYLAKHTISPDALQRSIAGAIYKAKTERLLDEQRIELERLFHEAKEANARKDQFLAALSHELRTPLSPILTAVSSIRPESLTPEQVEEMFAMIRRNVALEARLIDDLLDLTRIAKGKLRLDRRETDAHEVLRHALETCREDIAIKELDLTLHLEAELACVLADPARLQQVFWNLLKNAVKFTPRHGEVSVTSRNSESGHFEVQVRDTGIGISEAALPQIFKAFEQGEAHVNRQFGGLGLGLAISQALVEAHGGTIVAQSAGAGQGATFTVAFPAIAASREQTPHPAQDAAQAAAPRRPPASCKVLLVEDHADSARLLARSLRVRGYEVLTAGTVAEATAIFERESEFHALISDIGLPDGDGLALLTRLRQTRPIPAIALSGYGMEHDLARSRAAGFDEHLTKPVDWHQLEAALQRVLEFHQLPRPA